MKKLKMALLILSAVATCSFSVFGQTKKTAKYEPPEFPELKIKAGVPDEIRNTLQQGTKSTKEAYARCAADIRIAENQIEKQRRNRNAKDRAKIVEEKEKEIAELKKRIEKIASSAQVAEFRDGAAQGKIGVIEGGVRVKSVVDETTLLIEANLGSQQGDGVETLFITGVSTKGVVDGQAKQIDFPIKITGTRAFITVGGAKRTVFVAEKFDPSPYYEKSGDK